MSLSIVMLTSEAPHRRYILEQVASHVPVRAIVTSLTPVPPFETDHPFEHREEEYENQAYFHNRPVQFSDIAVTRHFDSVNQPDCLEYLEGIGPDLIVDVGTGRLGIEIVSLARLACLNVHGGDAEFYRGLDCHLWPVYNHDFDKIAVTLHYVVPELDRGDIIMKAQVPVAGDMEIFMLRSSLMVQVAGMLTLALDGFARHGWLPSYTQRNLGRYYSFMPSVLKDTCESIFQKHIQALRAAGKEGPR